MKLTVKAPESVGFQLAPMLDIVFLLLIFFVVTTKFILNEQDLKVKVPTAPKTTEETSRAIDEIIINAREDNGELIITVDREEFTREKLGAMLERMVRLNPDSLIATYATPKNVKKITEIRNHFHFREHALKN